MPIIARKPVSQFEPCPEGLFPAVCVDVIERPNVQTQYGTRDMVELRWQVPEVDSKGRRFQLRARYGLSLHQKATLRKVLEVWRGKKFTDEELAGFDLEKLITANCQVQVTHALGGEGEVYANVTAVVPMAKGSTKLVPVDYVRECDRQKDEDGDETRSSAGPDDDIPF